METNWKFPKHRRTLPNFVQYKRDQIQPSHNLSLPNISFTYMTQLIYRNPSNISTQGRRTNLVPALRISKISSQVLWLILKLKSFAMHVPYAREGMLQFRVSLSRQSNPSTLTVGLPPKPARTHPPPPFLVDEDEIGESGEIGVSISLPNRASWINGLATLLGGDPLKNGCGETISVKENCSTPCKHKKLNFLQT